MLTCKECVDDALGIPEEGRGLFRALLLLGMGALEFAIIAFLVLPLFAPRLGKLGEGVCDARRE